MKDNTIKKLAYMPYAQARVINCCGNVTLVSYRTAVATIDREGWLYVNGLYSMTTRKHIGAFMREYVRFPNGERGTYQFAKKVYKNGWRFNIHTGEVEDL